MEANNLFLKIKELGHAKSKRAELREFCKLNIEQILKYLPRRILNDDGWKVADCLFNGLSDHNASSMNDTSRYKAKAIDIIMKTFRKESTSLTHCGEIISRLCLELTRASVDDLVRWCNDSVQSIVVDSDVNMIWKDILPECLNGIAPSSNVKHCGAEMLSAEYREQCVRTLCQCNWTERQLVQLAAMFNDIQLSRNDHKLVVNKICSYIIDFPPDTLPALVYQLLKLCQTYDLDIVLSHLSHYFNVRLYSMLEPAPPDSESTTMVIDDIVPHSPAELSRCLSTCIYHITEGIVKIKLVRRYIRNWPRTQLLRAPFLLDIALAVSDHGDSKAVIRAAIEQHECEEQARVTSAWARAVLPPDVSVAGVLKVLTTESANHRQLTVEGLIGLAFSLLAVPRAKLAARACWSHGKLLLVRLSKAQPETASHILSQLADRLLTDCSQRQYADCLFILCKLTPVSVERCSQLGTILENCKPTEDYKSAALVLEAVHPLINYSIRTRDIMFMVCRKGLYSRDSAHRCLALSGFLSILKHVKVSGTFSGTQSQCSDESSHTSYLTQLTIVYTMHSGPGAVSGVRNETVCMEAVSVLRRCLQQDAAVKQLLYTKLYECVKDKPVLHECIIEFIYEHLSKYLPEEEGQSSLSIDACVKTNGATAVLIEPISHLLYVTAQFLQQEEEELEDILASQAFDSSATLRGKLALVMTQLCESETFGQIDMEDPGLTDLTPESKAKSLKVQQILSCYESLVAYQIMNWDRNNTRAAGIVLNLFKRYTQLLDQTKTTPKLGKKGSKSTLNDTRDTIKSQKSQKSQKDREKPPAKLSSLTKDRAAPFKPLPCVWDLKLCLRVVELLYSEEVRWCSLEQRNRVRGSRELHHWALRNAGSVVAGTDDPRAAAAVAAVLYKRCLCRFKEMCDFDDTTTLGCVELFKECLSVIFSPANTSKIGSSLSTITKETDQSQESSYIAAILEGVQTAFTQLEEDSVEEEGDAVAKKLSAALCQLATTLLEVPTVACERYTAAILKLEEYVRHSRQECSALVPALLAAGCRLQHDAPLLDQLLDKLGGALGRIDDEDTSAGGDEPTDFPTIDCRTGHAALTQVCAHLNARYKCTEQLLNRAKDLSAALSIAAHGNVQRIDKELKELYKSIVVQLCQLTTWTSRAGKLRCCVGGGSDRVLVACTRLYSLLAALVRQPDATVLCQAVRLERLLKLCGKKLSTVIDNLVTYVEGSQDQQRARRVLRDTKLIPRLVFEHEHFSRQLLQLGRRTQMNFQQYLALGTARDFRIRGPVIEEMLKDQDPEIEDEAADNEDEEMEVQASPQSENEEMELQASPQSENENEDSDVEPSKKKPRS